MIQKINLDFVSWQYTITALLSVYGVRLGWAWYLSSLRGPFGLLSIFIIVIPFLIVVFVVMALIVGLLIGSFHSKRKKITPITLFLVAVIAFFVPLPPIPKDPTPELEHFLEYRSDFERVVDLAKNSELHLGNDVCQTGIFLDESFNHLDENQCVADLSNEQDGLVLEFHPFDFYYPIHYVENPDATDRLPCNYDGWVETQIDENWYVCVREWN